MLGESPSGYVESQRKAIEEIINSPIDEAKCVLLDGKPVSAKLKTLMNSCGEFKEFSLCSLAEKNAIREKENQIYAIRETEEEQVDETILVRTPVFVGKLCVGYVENMTTYRKLAMAGIHPDDVIVITLAEISAKISEAEMLKEGMIGLKEKVASQNIVLKGYNRTKEIEVDIENSKAIRSKSPRESFDR